MKTTEKQRSVKKPYGRTSGEIGLYVALDSGKELKTRYRGYFVSDKLHDLSLAFGVIDQKKGKFTFPFFYDTFKYERCSPFETSTDLK